MLEVKISDVLWDKLYRAELFRGVRCPEGRNYEDFAVILPLISMSDKVYVLNERLVMHRRRPGSITRTITSQNFDDRCKSYCDYKRYVQDHIPELFTYEQLEKVTRYWYNILLNFSFSLPVYGFNKDDKITCNVNNEIEKCRMEINFKKCNWELKTMDYLYRHTHCVIGKKLLSRYRSTRSKLLICKGRLMQYFHKKAELE